MTPALSLCCGNGNLLISRTCLFLDEHFSLVVIKISTIAVRCDLINRGLLSCLLSWSSFRYYLLWDEWYSGDTGWQFLIFSKFKGIRDWSIFMLYGICLSNLLIGLYIYGICLLLCLHVWNYFTSLHSSLLFASRGT